MDEDLETCTRALGGRARHKALVFRHRKPFLSQLTVRWASDDETGTWTFTHTDLAICEGTGPRLRTGKVWCYSRTLLYSSATNSCQRR